MHETVLIPDCRSQSTSLFAFRIREFNVDCVMDAWNNIQGISSQIMSEMLLGSPCIFYLEFVAFPDLFTFTNRPGVIFFYKCAELIARLNYDNILNGHHRASGEVRFELLAACKSNMSAVSVGEQTIKEHNNARRTLGNLRLKSMNHLRLLFRLEGRRGNRTLRLRASRLGCYPVPVIRISGNISHIKVHILQWPDANRMSALKHGEFINELWPKFEMPLPEKRNSVEMLDIRIFKPLFAVRAAKRVARKLAVLSHLSQLINRGVANCLINRLNAMHLGGNDNLSARAHC